MEDATTPDRTLEVMPEAYAQRASDPEPSVPSRLPVRRGSLALKGLFVLAVFYTLYFGRPFFLPLALALLLNMLLGPLVRLLGRARIPGALGALLVVLLLVGGIGYGAYALSGPAAEWLAKAPQTLRRVEAQARTLLKPVQQVSQATESVERLASLGKNDAQQVEVKSDSLATILFAQTRVFLVNGVVMLVLLYFLLASGDLFLDKLAALLPQRDGKDHAVEIARHMEREISRYLGTVTLINICEGIAVGCATWALGLPNPLLWGVAAGMLEFVPFLGPMVMVGVLALVGLVTFPDDLTRAIAIPVSYALITGVQGYLLTPWILGRRLTLNPVAIFIGLMFWGWLWGVPGALLALPLLVTTRTLCERVQRLNAVAVFIGK